MLARMHQERLRGYAAIEYRSPHPDITPADGSISGLLPFQYA